MSLAAKDPMSLAGDMQVSAGYVRISHCEIGRGGEG